MSSLCFQYGKHAYLMHLMLEAKQPVLLAGEPGSGKTTLCQTLLSFDKQYIHLPASPILNSRDLLTIFSSTSSHRKSKNTAASMRNKTGLYLFVDDLHEAPCGGSLKYHIVN